MLKGGTDQKVLTPRSSPGGEKYSKGTAGQQIERKGKKEMPPVHKRKNSQVGTIERAVSAKGFQPVIGILTIRNCTRAERPKKKGRKA